jgi:hypothetical protein
VINDSGGIEYYEIGDNFENRYLNVKLTAANIPSDCFYVKVYGWKQDIDGTILNACVAAQILDGQSEKAADILCRIDQSPEYDEFYSEQYRMTNEDCEDTLLIEGLYANYDCDGNFYGIPQLGSDRHELKIRIPATIERSEYSFEELLVFNTRRSSKQSDTYLFRTQKLPPYVVRQLALIFNSKYIRINGVVYTGGQRFSKNFDEGSMWIVNTTLRTECDNIDFLCS